MIAQKEIKNKNLTFPKNLFLFNNSKSKKHLISINSKEKGSKDKRKTNLNIFLNYKIINVKEDNANITNKLYKPMMKSNKHKNNSCTELNNLEYNIDNNINNSKKEISDKNYPQNLPYIVNNSKNIMSKTQFNFDSKLSGIKNDNKKTFSYEENTNLRSIGEKTVVFSRCLNENFFKFTKNPETKNIVRKTEHNLANKSPSYMNDCKNSSNYNRNFILKNNINESNSSLNKLKGDYTGYVLNDLDCFNNNERINLKDNQSKNIQNILNHRNTFGYKNLLHNYEKNNYINKNYANYASFNKENNENIRMTLHNSTSYITFLQDKTPIKSNDNKIKTRINLKNILDKEQKYKHINICSHNNKNNFIINNNNNNTNNNTNENIKIDEYQKSISSDCSLNSYYNHINENDILKTRRNSNDSKENTILDDSFEQKANYKVQKTNFPNSNAITNTYFLTSKKKDVKYILIKDNIGKNFVYISYKKINFDEPRSKTLEEKINNFVVKKKKIRLPDFSKPNIFYEKNQKYKDNTNYFYKFDI